MVSNSVTFYDGNAPIIPQEIVLVTQFAGQTSTLVPQLRHRPNGWTLPSQAMVK